jgi:hypothetical protein
MRLALFYTESRTGAKQREQQVMHLEYNACIVNNTAPKQPWFLVELEFDAV